MRSRIFCALDTPHLDQAMTWARQVKGAVDGIKLGLEFFTAQGAAGVLKLMTFAGPQTQLFLDLKFHDIPNTVYGAVSSVMPLRPAFLTVHASGGVEMMRAAKQAAYDASLELGYPTPKILAVTVLTHMDQGDLNDVGQGLEIENQVKRLAELAEKADLDGIVCSPHEVSMLRQYCHDDFKLMVPGIRPEGAVQSDQKRVMTPVEAMQQGADYLVIGRPITKSDDPQEAAQNIVNMLEQAA